MMKTVDFGIAMGAGLGIKAGPGRLILDVRFTLGLTGIQDIDDEVEEALEAMGASIEKKEIWHSHFCLAICLNSKEIWCCTQVQHHFFPPSNLFTLKSRLQLPSASL